MKSLLVALALGSSACTVIGAGTGAFVGSFSGNALEGAAIGGVLGLRVDLELGKGAHDLGRKLCFWC